MESYLVDRTTLGQLADRLIAAKYPGQPGKAHKELREKIINDLDEQITNSIFDGLTEEQLDQLNTLLEKPNTPESEFEAFFTDSHIDLQEKISGIIKSYTDTFLKGGQNA